MAADGTYGVARRRRLTQRRKALGLTQEALAGLLGVDPTTVARWERAETEPLPWIRPKLARALRVSTDRIEELLAASAGASPGVAPGSPGPDPVGSGAGSGDSPVPGGAAGPDHAGSRAECSGAAAPGPDGSVPAAPGAAVRPRQLPATVTGFTGRAAELAALTKIVEDAATGGVAGPGPVVISAIGGTAGVGKTALAIQWAHQEADRFPDGQLHVNLRGYDPDQPMPAADALAGFLRALGVPGHDIPPEEHERAARYRTLLDGRRILVILDNAGSVEQVRPLLPGSASCTVLVTSRDSLAGLIARDGAARLDLDLLPLADAVGLLSALIGDRASADPVAAEALARRCCRLPLALRVAAELAIAQPGQPLASLVSELADQQGHPAVPDSDGDLASELPGQQGLQDLPGTDGGLVGTPAGQQRLLDLLEAGGDPRTAVRDVFSWSYRHLDDDSARAFRLAGLHPAADFDLYALAALTGSDVAQARRALDTLARAHLIQPARPGRYGMHDLLRAYATELAAARDGEDGESAALTRLFGYYLGTATTAVDILYPAEHPHRPPVDPPGTPAPPLPDAGAARSWLDDERPALVSVTRHAAGHGWPGHATRLSGTLWRYLAAAGHAPEAVVIHTSALLAARREGDRAAEGAALNMLGVTDRDQGRYRQAMGKFLEARKRSRQAGNRLGEAWALCNLGGIHAEQGDYRKAISVDMQAVNGFRQTGEREGEAITLGNLGRIMQRQGRYQEAARTVWQSVGLCREAGLSAGECLGLITLGRIALLCGDHQQADDLFRQALALARADGYRRYEGMALAMMGALRRHQDQPGAAAGHLHEALAMFRQLGDRADEPDVFNSLGELHFAEGRPCDARDCCAAALRVATETGDRYEQARARDGLGHAWHALGDTAEARRHWQEALALYTGLGVPQAAQVRARLGA